MTSGGNNFNEVSRRRRTCNRYSSLPEKQLLLNCFKEASGFHQSTEWTPMTVNNPWCPCCSVLIASCPIDNGELIIDGRADTTHGRLIHLRPSGVLSCWPDDLERTPGFYPGSNEQHRLFGRLLRTQLFARLCAIQSTHSLTRDKCVEPPLLTLNITLPAFAAERRRL